LPLVDEQGETNVRGIHAVGELAGTPLVKLGLNAGHDLVQRIGPALLASRGQDETLFDLLIVGSGSSGLAATVAARDLGLRSVTVEAGAFANTFVTMTKGKWLFAEPADVELRSRVWFEECTKEQLLGRWRRMLHEEQLPIHEQEKVVAISGRDGDFTVETEVRTYRCRKVALCMGKAGNPRKLGVPGERQHAARIHHRLLDPDDFVDQEIVIVGAGDVACEAAIALAHDGRNRVTLSAIDTRFTYPKQRNIDAVKRLEDEGRLRLIFDSAVTRFDADAVEIRRGDGSRERVRYDAVFEMIGAELPIAFLRNAGVRLNTDWHHGKWIALAAIFLLVYALYALKSYGKGLVAWPFESLITAGSYDAALRGIFQLAFAPFAWLFSAGALADIGANRGFQQGYLYSLGTSATRPTATSRCCRFSWASFSWST
jgi:thioredoxin reductase